MNIGIVLGSGLAFGLATLLIVAEMPRVTPLRQASEADAQATAPLVAGDFLIAAPGRVEPLSEEIRIAASVTGVLKQLPFKEGDHIRRGDVLARIDNDDYVANLNKADAEVKLQEAELQRVVNGARLAERRQSFAAVQEAKALESNAKNELDRRRVLAQASVASRAVLEQAQAQFEVAHHKVQEALERYNLINDPARDEDITIAEARVAAARAARDQAKAELNKTEIRSPIDGTVLRTYRHVGELLTVYVDSPILSIGDVSRLRVRAEVDEADIAKLKPGLPVYVTAEAYRDERFPGRVVRIGQALGRKNIITDEPRERTDTKTLDTLIELDSPNPLKPGLRVNVFITDETKASGATSRTQ